MRNTFIDTIISTRGADPNLFLISGDAGFGVFDTFQKEHPERFLNMGIAEQNMMSFAAGMALAGFKVVTYNIVPFILYRCYEQVRNDICYQQLPVVLAGIGSGVTYAPGGMTHYSVEDLGIAATLPNLTVLSPCDPKEAKAAADFCLTHNGPVYVRLAKRGEPVLRFDASIDVTMPGVLSQGSDATLVFHGSIGEEVVEAEKQLTRQGIHCTVISVPMVQPLNEEALCASLRGSSAVFCIEEHYTHCGLSARLLALKAKKRAAWTIELLGIAPAFIHDIKTNKGMREHFGISAQKIAQTVESTLKGNA